MEKIGQAPKDTHEVQWYDMLWYKKKKKKKKKTKLHSVHCAQRIHVLRHTLE